MKPILLNTAAGQIEYAVSGHGRPILFIHGGHVNCRETIFQKGLDEKLFHFITASRPGYGQTPLTDGNKSASGTASLLVALLDELKIPKVTVIGISAGGLTALEMAGNFPERVDKLVLMGALTKKWFGETDKVYKRGKIIFGPNCERYTWALYRLFFKLFPTTMTYLMFKELSKFRPIQYTATKFRELRKMTLLMRSGAGFSNDLDQNIDQQILDKVIAPTLILHGVNDNAVDISHSQHAHERIAHSRLAIFNNRWGHLLWLGTEYEPVINELKLHLDS